MDSYTAMGLLITGGLTVAAMVRGWRGWALLPALTQFLAGFIIGLSIGTMSLSAEAQALIQGAFALMGLLAWGVLTYMTIRGRRK